jgi:hypothetical protein
LETITLSPTGQVPIQFTGELDRDWSSRIVNGREQNRWHEVTLYSQANSDEEILHIAYHTQWAGESDFDEVYTIVSEERIVALIQNYNPLAHLKGYPQGEAYAKKQQDLEHRIIDGWNNIAKEIYFDLEISQSPPPAKSAEELNWAHSIPFSLHHQVMTEARKRKLKPFEVAQELLGFYQQRYMGK